MNSGISSGKPAQAIREDVDCTARPAAQRKGSLSIRAGLPAGRTAAFSMLPLLFALLMLPLGLAVSAPAEPSKLTGEALRRAVSGKTVLIATPIGSIPIRYNSNGTMTGRAPVFVASLGTQRDRGQWWIADDRLCQRWYRWLAAKRHCFKLQHAGPTVYWLRDDGLSGTATIASPQ